MNQHQRFSATDVQFSPFVGIHVDYGDGDSKAEGEKGGEKKVERGINQSHCKAEERGKKWQQIKIFSQRIMRRGNTP